VPVYDTIHGPDNAHALFQPYQRFAPRMARLRLPLLESVEGRRKKKKKLAALTRFVGANPGGGIFAT